MLLSCNEFQWFCVAGFTNQAQPASRDSKSPRLSHTSPKCCYGRVTASVSWKHRGRETLHTQGFPRRPRAGDTIQMPRVPPWFACGRPCRIAKSCGCAAKSFAALLGVFVALLFRMPRIASCSENVSSNRASVYALIDAVNRSSISTRPLPPNAAHVSVSAFS